MLDFVPVDALGSGCPKISGARTVPVGAVGHGPILQSSMSDSNAQFANETIISVPSVSNSVSKSIASITTDTITHYKIAPHSVAPVMVEQAPIADTG